MQSCFFVLIFKKASYGSLKCLRLLPERLILSVGKMHRRIGTKFVSVSFSLDSLEKYIDYMFCGRFIRL
jgi:hypothetical protein